MTTNAMRMSGGDWAVLLLLSAIWGASFLFIEIAVATTQPFTLVLIRLAIAALALWGVLLIRRERLPLPPGSPRAYLILGLLTTAIPFILFAYAQREITGSLGAILNATTPIWGVIVAHLFTRDEKATPAKAVGVLLGFGGVAAMIGSDVLSHVGTSVSAQLACLGATLCYALSGVYARRFGPMGIPPMAVATGQLTAGALVLLPLVLLFEPPWATPAPSAGAWMALVGLALLCTSFAYILYFRLVASAGATNSLLVTFLIPVSAILLGAIFLGERLEPRHVAGMALIGLGLAAIDGRLLRLVRRPADPIEAMEGRG